ncbi:UDP-glucose 4-epimerase [Sebaldella termitidis]|uniref:NAD-dependent epimerase/dehydratase n=1 Tax=Sebaldella termitidis (strain ATCC 33386 / NCTC 11300) TaxID=526218 RepID=D1APA3_SEBTE|nr:GDP-mannose 4,6-dehydratase [Sebaldella termitidis]ACZ09937.1 NAD-dependent epimerase/dehydratase [Sebaldella termitidis ATCC 33386]SUI25268.1 UDP-glucose 4-epimerase [Sebaldella termitidis]
MKTYLVTGGAGFIGSHLVEKLLKNGNKVINIDNFNEFYNYNIKVKNVLDSTGKIQKNDDGEIKVNELQDLKKLVDSENYILEIVDITNMEILEEIFQRNEIDTVIHLAAMAGVRPSIEKPLLYEKVNIRGTMNILELINKYNIKKFICASSSSVYGNNEKVPFSEKDNVDRAISPYAATKKSCEIIGHSYHHLYDIDTIMLRFFTVYGPRQRPDLAIHKFTKAIIEEKEIPFYGDGTTQRDYTYIDDIIDGVLKSIIYLEKNKNIYEIINLGESETISLRKMVKTLENEIGKKAVLKKLSMQPGDVNRTFADISKAKELIGYDPKTKFEEGIKKFVNWYRNK